MRASNDCIECCCLIPTFCISILVLVFGSLLIAQVTDPANEFFVNDIYAAPVFVFSWPEYSMAWSSDWFRAFAFIMWLLDWVGGPGKALFKRVMGVQVEPA